MALKSSKVFATDAGHGHGAFHAHTKQNEDVSEKRNEDLFVPMLLDVNGDPIRQKQGNHEAPISSGENQLLFLCIILCSLMPKNSILLLDEGDLHLSIPTADNFYLLLMDIAKEYGTQIVTVTHLPLMYSDRVMNFIEEQEMHELADSVEQDKGPAHPYGRWDLTDDNRDIGLMFIDEKDRVLGDVASDACQSDYKKAVGAMHKQNPMSVEDYPIIPAFIHPYRIYEKMHAWFLKVEQ